MTDTRFVILFCGGGSGGHTAPSVAVAQALRALRPDARILFACGTRSDAEFLRREGEEPVIVRAPKFPRGCTVGWFTFPFLFPLAVLSALRLVARERPSVLFSKGGYVSVPLCLAGYLLRIPVVAHESDSVQGMANRFIGRMAKTVCAGFPGVAHAYGERGLHTGNPVRAAVAQGTRERGRAITGFADEKPVILVMGGSQGAQALNEAVIAHAHDLLALGNIIHLTGEGKSGLALPAPGYWSASFVQEDLPHLYALADIAVTRAGAGSLSELAAVSKPAVTVPLRGLAQDHQFHNARMLAEHDAVILLEQERLAELPVILARLLSSAEECRTLGDALQAFFPRDAAERIARVLLDAA